MENAIKDQAPEAQEPDVQTPEEGKRLRKIYNASFLAYFLAMILCELFRIAVNKGFLSGIKNPELWDLVTTAIMQGLLIAGVPLVILTIVLRKRVKGTVQHLQFNKPKPYHFLGFVLGIVGLFSVLLLSGVSNMFFQLFGYHSRSGGGGDIDTFWKYLLAILSTAIFPAFCEEILHRGCFLRAQQIGGQSEIKTILINGLIFGLFHTYLTQTVYTMVMGFVLAYITVKSRSIWPAVFMHFGNNFGSVTYDYLLTATSLGDSAGFATVLMMLMIVSVPATIFLIRLFRIKAEKAGDAPRKKRVMLYATPYGFYGQNPYGQSPYNNPYTRNPYNQNPYNQNPYNSGPGAPGGGQGNPYGGHPPTPSRATAAPPRAVRRRP